MSLKIGSEGLDVGALQKALNENGANIAVDYALGQNTANAAIAYAVSKLLPDLGKEPTADKPKARISGIDIYRHDDVRSFEKAKASGIEFCSIQINQGVSRKLIHPDYREVSTAAKKAGMIVGPYSFAKFDEDIKAQANLFCDLVESQADFTDTDLMPMWDWEYYPESRGVKKGDGEKTLLFGEIVKQRLKRKMIIYSGYYTIMECLDKEPSIKDELSQYSFWLAWYTSENKIKTPSPWKHWHIWQKGEFQVAGVANPCDFNVFDGSLDDLKALIASSIIK
jgi:GH25 family lysozyme M1 (1,4-beta-N-acetylmuramidase)